MWTYHLVDVITGDKLVQVFPAPGGRWGRMVSDEGSGTHVLPRSGNVMSRAQFRDVTRHWARALVVSWDGVAKYAGLILDRKPQRPAEALEIVHKDLRVVLGRRFFHDVNGYNSKLVYEVVNQTYRGLAAAAVRPALVTAGGDQWRLPVVIPEPEAGSESRTYKAYEFTSAEAMLDEVERLENGPDVDFEPRWRPDGRLEWLMRIGSPRLTDVPKFEFPVNVDEPKVFDIVQDDDGTEMLSGLLSIGKGAEQDIRVGKGMSLPGPVIPFLDSSDSFKEISDVGVLNQHARGELRARRNSTEQFTVSVRTDSIDVGQLRLGTTIRLRFQGDWWEEDGHVDMYTLAYAGDGTDTLTLELQDPRRIA